MTTSAYIRRMPDEPSEPKLMTSRQVADRFQVDVTSVRRWVASGKLKVAAVTPGGQFRFSEDDIAALVTRREEPPG